jgi:hypothetical protein
VNPESKHSSALASCTLFCRKTQVADTHTYRSLVSHSSDATAKDMETSTGKGMDAALERSKMSAAVCTALASALSRHYELVNNVHNALVRHDLTAKRVVPAPRECRKLLRMGGVDVSKVKKNKTKLNQL